MTREAHEMLAPAEERAREALRALPRPAADPAFRARLKREFMAGSITSPLEAEAGEDRGARFRPGERRVVRGPWRAWTPLAWAAAAAIVIATAAGLDRGPAWRVMGASGSGILVVDGRPVPVEHTEQLANSLHAGARIQVPEGAQLELAIPRTLMIDVTPGTEMVLPRSPGRWLARNATAEIRRGELRITTGAGFHGARLAVLTPQAGVQVTGTTLAVICEPQGTCVCVLEGRVMVGPRAGAMEQVTGGKRRYIFGDGRPPEMAEMRDTERTPLAAVRERMLDLTRSSH